MPACDTYLSPEHACTPRATHRPPPLASRRDVAAAPARGHHSCPAARRAIMRAAWPGGDCKTRHVAAAHARHPSQDPDCRHALRFCTPPGISHPMQQPTAECGARASGPCPAHNHRTTRHMVRPARRGAATDQGCRAGPAHPARSLDLTSPASATWPGRARRTRSGRPRTRARPVVPCTAPHRVRGACAVGASRSSRPGHARLRLVLNARRAHRARCAH